MELSELVLDKLMGSSGNFVSGAKLAEMLGVSRSAIWKAVLALKKRGYAISSVTNRGYCFEESNDIVSPQGIRRFLSPELGFLELSVKDAVSSTNTVLRAGADNGGAEGCVVISNTQSEGRGRRGRVFFSPPDTGIYLSVLLRPKLSPELAALITSAAAVAVCEAIRLAAGIETRIKWVNDIFLNGRKICGILTEGSMDFETGGLSYVVLGVGINLRPPCDGFPDELKGIAGALFCGDANKHVIKNRLIAEFLNVFFMYYNNLESREFIDGYRELSLVTGHRVLIHRSEGQEEGLAVGIDKNARLLLKLDNGETRALSAGEISIAGLCNGNNGGEKFYEAGN